MLEQRVDKIVTRVGQELLDDGLGFELVEVKDGNATIELLIDPQVCADCVVPDETLKAILLQHIQKKFPVIHAVTIVRKEVTEGFPEGR